MITKEDSARIWREVKENHAKLRACSNHEFVDLEPTKQLGKKYQCKHCGGTLDGIAVHWYNLGKRHGLGTNREPPP
jgi:predicted SprT family Zn-dependent metalloprotease